MATKRKPAIERPEGVIDDIAKWGYKRIAHSAAKRTNKAISVLEKIGGVTKSVDPATRSPRKTIKKWDKYHKKYSRSADTNRKYLAKAGYDVPTKPQYRNSYTRKKK